MRLNRARHQAREREARERVALTVEAEQAIGAMLNGASIEAKQATKLRREAERESALLAVQQAELNQLRDTLQRERAA